MKDEMLSILSKLARKKGVIEFQWLSGCVRGFKALPKNRKRWLKNERPEEAEIRFLGTYEDALDLCQRESEKLALIVWIPRKEFLELLEKGRQEKK